MNIVGLKEVVLKKEVRFRAIARDSSIQNSAIVSYTGYGLPMGAELNASTGEFTWTPTQSGVYTFYIFASDDQQPPRIATKFMSLTVPEPLPVFGQSFFTKARGLVDARLALMKTALLNLQGMAGGGAPGNVQNSQNPNSLAGLLPNQGPFPASGQGAGPAPAAGTVNSGGASTSGQPAPATGGSTAANGGGPTPQSPSFNWVNPAVPNAVQGAGSLPNQPTTGFNSQVPAYNWMNPMYPMAPQGPGYFPGQSFSGFGPQNPAFYPLNPSGFQGSGNMSSQSINGLQGMVGPFEQAAFNIFLPSPERYQLGAGDQLHLKIWADTVPVREFDLLVDDSGGINLPIGGRRIVVRGKTLGQSENQIRLNLSDFIRNPQITVSLSNLRTMTVLVLGEAYLPGAYQVPSVATLFNTIYMVGGPSDTGSYRNIELRRSDGSTRHIDLYAFLESGDTKEDVPLQPGDVILIPSAQSRVTVSGEVSRPGIYEAKKSESLSSLLKHVGGAKPSGYSQAVTVATVKPGIGRVVRSVNVADVESEDKSQLLDGDTVTVSSIPEKVTNQILLEGAVRQPGTYEFQKGQRFSDLISKANGVLTEAYMQQADVFRMNPDQSTRLLRVDVAKALSHDASADLALEASDRVVVYDVHDVQWTGSHMVEIRGSVRNPGPYYRPDNMPASDLVMQAGGVLPEAYLPQAYVQRVNEDGTPGELLKINLQGVIGREKPSDLILQDRDILIVQNIRDAQYVPDGNVRLIGAVVNPGTYVRASKMKISDLLELGGGTLPNTGGFVEVSRMRVKKEVPPLRISLDAVRRKEANADVVLNDGDVVSLAYDGSIRMEQHTVYITGLVARPGPYSVNGVTERLSDLIKRAGGLKPNAFVEGGQLSRDPSKTKTAAQLAVSQHLQQAFQVVAQDEYRRALARARTDQAKILSSVSGKDASSGIPNIPGITPNIPSTTQPVTLPSSLTTGPDLVTPSRPLTDADLAPGGNVNVDFARVISKPGGVDDMVLQDGDVVSIPEVPTSVSVIGAVIQPSLVLYRAGSKVDYYVKRSGGFAADVAMDQIMVVHANGLIAPAKGIGPVRPGDIIWVPTRVMAARLADKSAEIETISKEVSTGAILIAVLRSLLK